MLVRALLTICVFLISYNFINGQSPNYSEDIAPIIYNICLQCHHVGGISSLSLETYANTVTNAGSLAIDGIVLILVLVRVPVQRYGVQYLLSFRIVL